MSDPQRFNVPRCPRHYNVPPHNMDAQGGTAECGACIMLEVTFLYHTQLDLLDEIADLLIMGAKKRARITELQQRLARYEAPTVIES